MKTKCYKKHNNVIINDQTTTFFSHHRHSDPLDRHLPLDPSELLDLLPWESSSFSQRGWVLGILHHPRLDYWYPLDRPHHHLPPDLADPSGLYAFYHRSF